MGMGKVGYKWERGYSIIDSRVGQRLGIFDFFFFFLVFLFFLSCFPGIVRWWYTRMVGA